MGKKKSYENTDLALHSGINLTNKNKMSLNDSLLQENTSMGNIQQTINNDSHHNVEIGTPVQDGVLKLPNIQGSS